MLPAQKPAARADWVATHPLFLEDWAAPNPANRVLSLASCLECLMRLPRPQSLLAAIFLATAVSRPRDLPRLCRVCKQQYSSAMVDSCRYHSGRWMGAENSKHHGSRSGGGDTGLSLFWDCCDGDGPDAPGCCIGRHRSYEDSDDSVFVIRRN